MDFRRLEDALAADPATVTSLTLDADDVGVLSTCPEALWTLTALESLSLRWHRLPVTAGIAHLRKLERLEVAGHIDLAPEVGALASLRELSLETPSTAVLHLPEALGRLQLERLCVRSPSWGEYIAELTRIPVSVNVTLLGGSPYMAEDLERADLSAWRELREMELDVDDYFEPTVLQRKLPRCGFCLNRSALS